MKAAIPPRPVPALLFRQTLLVLWLVGVAAFSRPEMLAAVGLVAALDARCRGKRLLAGLLCLALGFVWAWARQGVEPDTVRELAPLRGVVEGRVDEVSGQSDRRLRILLRHVTVDGNPVLGGLNLTWEGAEAGDSGGQGTRPLPGQTLRFTGKVTPVTGFRNAAGLDSTAWWARQDVAWRAWLGGDKDVTVSGEAGGWALRRETLRLAFMARVQAVFPQTVPPFVYGQPGVSLPHGAGFLPALVFGDRFYLSAADADALSRAGLIHSIALSGQHLALAGLCAAVLLWGLGRLWPQAFLRRPRLVLWLWASLPFAAAYVWIGNAPPSLVRAALMLVCWTVLCTLRRPMALVDGLLLALGLMTLADPATLNDLGVQLSFAAVFGLWLAAPVLSVWPFFARAWMLRQGGAWHDKCAGKWPERLITSLGLVLLTSMAVQLSTLPVVLSTFGWTTPWFWLNVLWLPVLGLVVLPLCAVSLLLVALHASLLADVTLRLAAEPCHWLMEGLRLLENFTGLDVIWCLRPYWLSLLGYSALLVAVALVTGRRRGGHPALRPRKSARVLAVVGLCLLVTGPFVRLAEGFSSTVRLRLLDVGQGQAALLEFPLERRVLVDGGGFRSARFDSGRDIVAPVLTDNRPPRLDALAVSHADQDHLRGLLFLADQFTVNEVLVPLESVGHDTARGLYADYLDIVRLRGIPLRALRAGDSAAWGDVRLEALAPVPGLPMTDNDGLVLRLTGQGRGLAVLPGDADRRLLRTLAKSGESKSGEGKSGKIDADILVAPHHGSRHNMQPPFLETVNPRQVLVSCGQFNSFGFPSEELRLFCRENDVVMRSTADEGEIVVEWRF